MIALWKLRRTIYNDIGPQIITSKNSTSGWLLQCVMKNLKY